MLRQDCGFAGHTIAGYGVEETILSFSFSSPVLTVAVRDSSETIIGTLPPDANATGLIPTITLPAKAAVSPASGVAQDFTEDVVYTVIVEDGSTQRYTATTRTSCWLGRLRGLEIGCS